MNHHQMIHDGKITSVVKVGMETALQTSLKPVFSFEYDILKFSTSVKEITWGGETTGITPEQAEEILIYLETVEEDKAITQMLKDNYAAKDYLHSTDWYVIRQLETGVPVPAEITEGRASARAKFRELPQ